MGTGSWRIWVVAVVLAGVAMAAPFLATAAPVEIRIGHGFAAEEQLWLMKARPDLTPNQGKAYTLRYTPFRGNTDRFNAFLAGQIDGGTVTGFTAIFARSEGVPLKIVASICRESLQGFRTTFLAAGDSGIQRVSDLRGRTIGIVDFKSATDLWAREALRKEGIDPDRDAKLVVVAFPAQGNALRTRKIDAGVFPQPFYAAEMGKGGVRAIFDSKYAFTFDEELMQIFFSEKFLREQRRVVEAFLSDYLLVNKFYIERNQEARRAHLDAKMVRTPEKIYLEMADWYRTPDARVDLESLTKLQEMIIANGWLEKGKRINVRDLVDLSYLPR
ncbi:MAG: ABC transporter substrate-binding protein [Deltaproteobacteria bacterium]|nr:ABC transporter substrate-binding protein [Deltaproteobacteria bacterium]